MNLVTDCKMRLETLRLHVKACYDKLARAEREAKKENRSVPRYERDRIEAEIRDAKANVYSAEATVCGVSKYPPLKVA